MNAHTDKTQRNKSQSVANEVPHKQSGRNSTSLVNNRPEAIAQRKLQETAKNSTQANQVNHLQSMANNYSSQQHQPIQKKASLELGRGERLVQKGAQSLVVQRAAMKGWEVQATVIKANWKSCTTAKDWLTGTFDPTFDQIQAVCEKHVATLKPLWNNPDRYEFYSSLWDFLKGREG